MADKKPCASIGCERPSRARGLCDTHYRGAIRRERGIGGIQPMDAKVYKVRVKTPNGSQPVYYSNQARARVLVEQARRDGTLLYYAEYTLEHVIDGTD